MGKTLSNQKAEALENVTAIIGPSGNGKKEMEAWLLGDEKAILVAYPEMKRKCLKEYQQDDLCDTWEVLANAVYSGGLAGLRKKAKNPYSEIVKGKCEWADEIGKRLDFNENKSPSFQEFLTALQSRIGVA